jgi:hypothetical protein
MITKIADKDSDGIILMDWPYGKYIGFTSKKFFDGSDLWKEGRYIHIIKLKTKHFVTVTSLLKRIEQIGMGIVIANPDKEIMSFALANKYCPASRWEGPGIDGGILWLKNPRERIKPNG